MCVYLIYTVWQSVSGLMVSQGRARRGALWQSLELLSLIIKCLNILFWWTLCEKQCFLLLTCSHIFSFRLGWVKTCSLDVCNTGERVWKLKRPGENSVARDLLCIRFVWELPASEDPVEIISNQSYRTAGTIFICDKAQFVKHRRNAEEATQEDAMFVLI